MTTNLGEEGETMTSGIPSPEASASRPVNNAVTAAIPADWTPGIESAIPTPFAQAVDNTLRLTAELARNLVGAHQSAAALIVSGDWKHARKWFSLSSKYADWYNYRAPAVGFGLHALVIAENKSLRLTQAEVEAHPAWKGFSTEAQNHPPMRGWLAVPLIGQDQHNYGLLQLSDKYNDAEFTEDDESHLQQLARLTATTLDALRALYHEDQVGIAQN
jgi:GAF domain-containing protein